ncbi:DUF1648 domain-containing protein [Polaribacter tangerinus]|uniref:DUF1648 domain-containing protein n=1 Tax=Polaribacter tangerinus TaxID=1920034 RepID=UPI000B4AE659|nr:DUF1648 domain-containing protein [Polaribacter tangerinus]
MMKLHKIIIFFSVSTLIITWFYTAISYSKLPLKIVGHLDFYGNINRYDPKIRIWFIPTIFTTLHLLIYWISKQQNTIKLKLKTIQAQKTVILLIHPYLSITTLLLVICIIEKTKNIHLNLSYFSYAFIAITGLYLTILFSFIYNNLKS